MGKLTCLEQDPGATPHCMGQAVGRTWQQFFLGVGRERLPVMVVIDVRWACWLAGKPAEEQNLPLPFEEPSRWGCSDPKIRTVTSWGQGEYVGRPVIWTGFRWSRNQWSKGCSEGKGTAIRGSLILYYLIPRFTRNALDSTLSHYRELGWLGHSVQCLIK